MQWMMKCFNENIEYMMVWAVLLFDENVEYMLKMAVLIFYEIEDGDIIELSVK
jgi:hypothetical protein